MSYHYQDHREWLFTDEGQRQFLQVRDGVKRLLEEAGAFQMGCAMATIEGGYDSWQAMACVDRLVELGEIVRITKFGSVAGQFEVFVKTGEEPNNV